MPTVTPDIIVSQWGRHQRIVLTGTASFHCPKYTRSGLKLETNSQLLQVVKPCLEKFAIKISLFALSAKFHLISSSQLFCAGAFCARVKKISNDFSTELTGKQKNPRDSAPLYVI